MPVAVDWVSGSEALGFNEDFAEGGAKGCGSSMFMAKLDDSPMFRRQIQLLEGSAELLKDRCLKFYKGCRKYTEGLGEGYDGDIAFASSLEMFGGGHNDPISVAFGGPVMTKFTIAMREIGSYKEVLRSQAENMLNDRLLQFVEIYLNDVKDAHKRFEKASLLYDQARERYLSLKKGTKADIVAILQDELHRARSSFEEARFNLVTALSTIEATKRHEFLEAVSGTMDAHLCYFKQCYELLHQMEPYIHQVQAYVQQSRDMYNHEQAALVERMQDFRRQIDRESQLSANGSHDSSNGDGTQATGSSYKMIQAVMQSAAKGKVETIRQGYLSKRSSNLRGDWKRRFFVLDSRGLLYYYRKELNRRSGSSFSGLWGHSEHGSGLLSRWFSSHYHGGVHYAKPAARHTVNLLTSTIKSDADQSDLRFCFRIISPTRTYTLQAESSADQMYWIEKITGVIASLLSSQLPEQRLLASPRSYVLHRAASESSSFSCSCDLDHSVNDELSLDRNFTGVPFGCSVRSSQHHRFSSKQEKPVDVLRKVHGNDVCVDCGAPEPDWASLNLGVLLCIACSGAHRNLGVHISKVRSLTLDVRAWEPSVINLFQSLGNTYANSVWEQHLLKMSNRKCEEDSSLFMLVKNQEQLHSSKPKQSDPISVKEKFIHAKYAEKHFISRQQVDKLQVAQQLWHSVCDNDKKAVYHYIVTSNVDINLTYQESTLNLCLNIPKAMLVQDEQITVLDPSTGFTSGNLHHNPSTISYLSSSSTDADGNELYECFEGFTLLHLACWTADIGMVELLLQHGAYLNSVDLSRRTPLHHCVLKGKRSFAKLLLSRGADPHSADKNGKTPLQYADECGNSMIMRFLSS